MTEITAEDLSRACVRYIKRHQEEHLRDTLLKIKDIKYHITCSWYSKGLDKCYEHNELHELMYQLQVVILNYQLCLRSLEKIEDIPRRDGYHRIIFEPIHQKMIDLMVSIDQIVSNRTDQRYMELKPQLLELFDS